MIVSDIITRVRRVFGDEAAVQVSDEDIMRWINDGQVEIVKHNDGALPKTDFVDVVAKQSTYIVPTDLFILRSLRFKFDDMLSYGSLAYQSMQQFDELVDGWDGSAYGEGRPAYFTKFEDNIILFPTPERDSLAGLKLLYNRKPTDVVLIDDSLDLPLIYHNTIWKYCMWQASLLDETHEPAMMYRKDFEIDMSMLSNRETKEGTATYPMITVLEEDL